MTGKGMALGWARRGAGWVLGKTSWKSGQVLEQAARGCGGVTNLGGVQETFICCTEGHVSVGDSGDREVFSNPGVSMILWFVLSAFFFSHSKWKITNSFT